MANVRLCDEGTSRTRQFCAMAHLLQVTEDGPTDVGRGRTCCTLGLRIHDRKTGPNISNLLAPHLQRRRSCKVCPSKPNEIQDYDGQSCRSPSTRWLRGRQTMGLRLRSLGQRRNFLASPGPCTCVGMDCSRFTWHSKNTCGAVGHGLSSRAASSTPFHRSWRMSRTRRPQEQQIKALREKRGGEGGQIQTIQGKKEKEREQTKGPAFSCVTAGTMEMVFVVRFLRTEVHVEDTKASSMHDMQFARASKQRLYKERPMNSHAEGDRNEGDGAKPKTETGNQRRDGDHGGLFLYI